MSRRAVPIPAAAALLCVLFFSVAAQSIDIDTLYQTGNANWTCHDAKLYDTDYCMTDNTTLTVFAQSTISSTGKTNIADALARDFVATPFRLVWMGFPIYRGDAETDIIYRAASLNGTLDGYTWCDNAVTFDRCDQHYVQFESATPSLSIICHESGHAVGLTHGRQSFPAQPDDSAILGCMRLPAVAITFGSLNLANLNENY